VEDPKNANLKKSLALKSFAKEARSTRSSCGCGLVKRAIVVVVPPRKIVMDLPY